MATQYIGSVSPIPLKVERPLYSGLYVFPAVKRGEEPFVLEIADKVQYDRQPVTQEIISRHIRAEAIAADILREVNEGGPGMGADASMGLFLIGTTPHYTPEQKAEAVLKLRNYLNWLVQDTDSWSPERRARFISQIGIPPIRKIAVQYLGLERDWATMTPDQTSVCPHCRRAVKIAAITCEHCDGIIDYDAWAQNEAKKAAALAKFMHPEAAKVVPNIPMKQQPR